MDRMVVVVFDSEPKAFEGLVALRQLDAEGDIAIYASAVVTKQPDGQVRVNEEQDDVAGLGTLTGMAVGALIGLIGGPIGVVAGAATGTMIGAGTDLAAAGVDQAFVDEVSAQLTPGRAALIASVDEDWTTPLDTRMEALGGVVYRRARYAVVDDQDALEAQAIDQDIAQYRAEMAQANAERKKKLQARIDSLEASAEQHRKAADARHQARKADFDSKIATLDAKADKAGADAKSRWDTALAKLKTDYNHLLDKLKVK